MAPQPSGGEGVTKSPGSPGSGKLTPGQIAWVAAGTGWTKEQRVIAVAIALAESGGDLDVHGPQSRGADAIGLWQINMYGDIGLARIATFGLSKEEDLYDPFINARVAYGVYKSQGWKAWTTYTNGRYKGYLGIARNAVEHPERPKQAQVGGDLQYEGSTAGPLDQLYDALVAPALEWFGQGALRVAGFVGGGILLVIVFVMLAKGRVK